MFIRSYEQGERTYTAMLCRGYGRDAFLLVPKKPLLALEWAALAACMAVVVGAPLAVFSLRPESGLNLGILPHHSLFMDRGPRR